VRFLRRRGGEVVCCNEETEFLKLRRECFLNWLFALVKVITTYGTITLDSAIPGTVVYPRAARLALKYLSWM